MNFAFIRHMRTCFLCLAVSIFSFVVVTFADRKQSPPIASRPVTFSHDIAPIVFRYCAPCHHSGEAGPFPLLTYGDVKSHARQIADVTNRRLMPPWLPSLDGLQFEEDSHLSEEQIALFEKWVADGSPRGDPSQLPPVPKFSSGWQLGKPDLVLKAAAPFSIPASGSDVYWNFIFRSPVNLSRFVKAIEIHPGDKRLVHHANLLVDRTQSARRKEKSPGSGFAGMELQIESEAFDPDGHFLFWKPGSSPIVEPPGFALRLDAGNDLVLNTHLQPSGKVDSVQPTIGVYFTNEPATKFPVLLQLENDRALNIPAGENNPADFESHYNLAAMLQARGAPLEALEHYQAALALRPGDATVENALGGALLAANRISEAIAHLNAAASARPDYFDAHYNLGIAQGTAGNFSDAVRELTTAVKLK